MTVTLGERTEALQILDDWLREHGDELAASGGELPAFLFELIEQAEGDFKAKALRVARYVLRLDGEAKQIADEIARLQQRAKVRANAAERLREYLRREMQATGLREIDDPFVTVRLQQGPPKVTVDDSVTKFDLQLMYERAADHNNEGGEEVRQFIRYTPAEYDVDKRAVLAAHKAGEPLPAAFVVERDDYLRIR